MSGRKHSGDDDDEVTVIRSADGKTSKISISLSSNLNTLKDAINSDKTLGPIKRKEQRLFHLGKELKSGNLSLETLGIGNFNVYSIHLHSLVKTVDLQSDDEEEDAKKSSSVRRKSANNNDVIDLDGASQAAQRQHQQQEQDKVVELLDSDSDDSDIEIVEQAPKRRK